MLYPITIISEGIVKPVKYEIVITKRVGSRSEISTFDRTEAIIFAGRIAKALFEKLSEKDYGVLIKEIKEFA